MGNGQREISNMKKSKFDIQSEDVKLLPRSYLEKIVLTSVIFNPLYVDRLPRRAEYYS